MTTEEKIVNTTVEETNEVSTNEKEAETVQFIEVKKDSFFKRAGKGIGKIAKKAGHGVKKVVTSPVTKALVAGIAVGATGVLTYVVSKGMKLAENDEENANLMDVFGSVINTKPIDTVDENVSEMTDEQTEEEAEGEKGD